MRKEIAFLSEDLEVFLRKKISKVNLMILTAMKKRYFKKPAKSFDKNTRDRICCTNKKSFEASQKN
jgi:hypothetical protein